jgi:O-antigen/teichoic acid export membrane protein
MVVSVCRFTVLITLLSVVGLVPAAFVAVHVLLPDFVDSLPAFLILMPGVVALTVAKVLSSYISGLGVPLQVAAASGSALVVNVIANLLLIPLFGILGAALASLISYSVNAGMLLSIAARLSRRGPFDFLLPTGAELRRLMSGLREVYALLRRSPQAEEN